MDTVVAFVVDHESVAVLPPVMAAGEADNVAVGVAVCTVMVAVEVAVPLLPVAVRVYSVVADGVTVVDPEAGTLPMPGAIETEVELAVVQVSVAGLPATILAGVPVRLAVGVAATFRLIVVNEEWPHLSHS